MAIRNISSLIILIILSLKLSAQNNNTEIIDITAKIINSKNNKPVGYATIVNEKKGTVALSDTLGYFHITIIKSDELKISAIGFNRMSINFKDSIFDKLKVYYIYINEKTYDLQKINIYEARWKDFEYEFANMDIKNNETQEKIQNWFQSIISTQELALITSAAAIGIPINFKTSKDKQRIKVNQLEKIDIEEQLIRSKYNDELISKITGLNKQNAKEFMNYCNFSHEFLIQASEYDLITEIKKRYTVYKKRNNINFR